MKIYTIRDEESKEDIGWMLYYDRSGQFFIELSDQLQEQEAPLFFSPFLRRGIRTLDAHWSREWVRQRIVPTDRQNLGNILREHSMYGYDEHALLRLTAGRCPQDACRIVEWNGQRMPEVVETRQYHKVRFALAISDNRLLVIFKDQSVKIFDLSGTLSKTMFAPVRWNPELIRKVEVETGGYGVTWGDRLVIPDLELYQAGTQTGLGEEDIRLLLQNSLMNTAEAAELLGCSRQNIDDLVRRGKLCPVRSDQKNMLFLKSDLEERLW